jgi:two-component sensor histidine kinase
LRSDTLLLRELTHRIANDWTCAISTISETARQSHNAAVKTALDDLNRRLMCHVELMRALQVPVDALPLDAADYLARVCRAVSRSKLEESNIRLIFAAEPLVLAPNSCLRLGMIVSELIANSARHAFRGLDGGTVWVYLCRNGEMAKCHVSDNGSARPNARAGHGLTIARELIASLDGTIEQQFKSGGSIAILRFPL